MKADYKNWMPKGMVASFIGGTAGALAHCAGCKTPDAGGTGKERCDRRVRSCSVRVWRRFCLVLPDVPGV